MNEALEILEEAVSEIGGQPRSGQIQMAQEVAHALQAGEHLLVQAGTGTGKSLGYLAPVLALLNADPRSRVVIATATLALQTQLFNKDIPAVVKAATQVSKRSANFALLKGRSNYACLQKVHSGVGVEQGALFESSDFGGNTSELGKEVVELREWALEQAESAASGDRDDAPSHGALAWSQISVSTAECLSQQCPFVFECFAERARSKAREAQLVVTNHALLAIDAMGDNSVLGEYSGLVVDEAHELAARVTSACSHELSPQQVARLAKRALPYLAEGDLADSFTAAAGLLEEALEDAKPQRLTDPNSALAMVITQIRDIARNAQSALSAGSDDSERKQCAAALGELFEAAEIMSSLDPMQVIWISERERYGRQLVQSPLDVSSLIREVVFADMPTVLTSATLKVGGDFAAVARNLGIGDSYRSIDVGSPFDYSKQGILYVAAQLPAPNPQETSEEMLAQIAELIWAAGGRTLGLFASQRAAEAAARYCRGQVQHPVLCQGDAQLSELTKRFITEPDTCLFGTLSLWQGIDVPGDTCQLVIIDKIPFPRPDDPLMQARQQAFAAAGGNGFMGVAAAHAGLLLAQGAGRLIRTLDDRGVVAILDSRMATKGYGSFLLNSMPDFWTTTNFEAALASLRRLSE